MQKVVTVFLCLLACTSAHGQQKVEGHWGKKFLDVAYANAACNDGGYIMTGLSLSAGDTNGDIVVIKTSATGDTTWSFTYGGPKIEGGNSVIQTADGGYMVSGHTEDFGASDCDAFMMKLDKNGSREWFKVYGAEKDEISEGVVEVPGGGYVIAGITESWGNPNGGESRHMYFVRTNSTGDMLWYKYYAGNSAEYAYSIANGYKSGFFANGWSTSFGNGEHDGWLLRLNDNGDTLWTRLYKNGGDTKFYKIMQTLDDGYIMAGYTTSSGTSKSLGFAVKLDGAGNEQWRRTYGSQNDGIMLHDVAQLPNGDYIFSGVNYSTDTAGNAYVLTTDSKGTKVTDNICGGHFSFANCIAVQGNNSYMISGYSAQYGDPYGDLYYMEINNTIDANVHTVTADVPRMFPNPVKDRSVIILPSAYANQTVNFDITDASGKLVSSQNNIMAKNLIINGSTLAIGTYQYKITCKDGKVYKGRFLIAE